MGNETTPPRWIYLLRAVAVPARQMRLTRILRGRLRKRVRRHGSNCGKKVRKECVVRNGAAWQVQAARRSTTRCGTWYARLVRAARYIIHTRGNDSVS